MQNHQIGQIDEEIGARRQAGNTSSHIDQAFAGAPDGNLYLLPRRFDRSEFGVYVDPHIASQIGGAEHDKIYAVHGHDVIDIFHASGRFYDRYYHDIGIALCGMVRPMAPAIEFIAAGVAARAHAAPSFRAISSRIHGALRFLTRAQMRHHDALRPGIEDRLDQCRSVFENSDNRYQAGLVAGANVTVDIGEREPAVLAIDDREIIADTADDHRHGRIKRCNENAPWNTAGSLDFRQLALCAHISHRSPLSAIVLRIGLSTPTPRDRVHSLQSRTTASRGPYLFLLPRRHGSPIPGTSTSPTRSLPLPRSWVSRSLKSRARTSVIKRLFRSGPPSMTASGIQSAAIFSSRAPPGATR